MNLLEALLQTPLNRNGFDDASLEKIRPLIVGKRVILLCFPPKCGGTYLGRVLAMLLAGLNEGKGRSVLRGSFMGDGGSERDLYYPELLIHEVMEEGQYAVIHNHQTATDGNLALIDLFGLKPVVMCRSVSDMLVSVYDAAVKRGSLGDFGSSYPEDETFFEMDMEGRKDYLVYNYAPWYVKYYASWFLGVDRGKAKDVLFLEYDDFRKDPGGTVQEILSWTLSLKVSDDGLSAVLAHADSKRDELRYNKGVSGRGAEFFSNDQLGHLRKLTSSYQTIEFDVVP